jgi:hypothetical protein
MSTLSVNPFRPTRWEHHLDGRHLIWYTEVADELTAEKSTFVYGNRGSGKTTLLRGICWEDLAYNESLRLQKKVSDFDHVGVYIRFPDQISSSFSEKVWKNAFDGLGDPLGQFHRIFSLLIESACVEKILTAMHELRKLDDIQYTPTSELLIVSDLFKEFPNLDNFSRAGVSTFSDAAHTFRSMSREISQLFGRAQMEALWEKIPAREPSELLNYVCERLASAATLNAVGGQCRPRFKFCFDDCEVLDQFQRKSLNTIVRQSRSPVSWVVASVGKSQWAGETFINSQPLTDADRSIISLDRREKEDFGELCQAVVSLRLLFSLPKEIRPKLSGSAVRDFFDLNERLGVSTVNQLIHKMVRRSSRPIAKDVILASETLKEAMDATSAKRRPKEFLPYYEAYTLLHWQGDETSFSATYNRDAVQGISVYAERMNDPAFGAWLRRKQLNALLQLSAKLSHKRIPLSGANQIISLSDSSIRDFLEIMSEIFDENASKLYSNIDPGQIIHRFCESRTKVSDESQTKGIYAASESYFEGISNRFDVEGDLLTRIVSGLAHLTSLLQSDPSDSRVLAFAERGIFLFGSPTQGEAGFEHRDVVINALKQAELAGYLRPVSLRRMPRRVNTQTGSSIMAYRLHKRFAPNFRFSYRGAYEPFRITLDEVYELFLCTERGSSLQWAQKMGSSSDGIDTNQFTLPLHDRFQDEV